jgi:DNA (cytosine-5)-methyltransferase 1
MVVQPFVKIVRSGERDADGNLPAEVWAERQTAPTLNLMDNTGESRATVIALQNTVIGRSDTAGPQGRGHSDEGGPMFTIDTTSPHGIVFHPHRTDGVRLQDKTINTLTAFMGTGGLNTSMISTEVVRRITPVECERLQGFPDNWTAVSDGKPQSDSARYKQTGNAVAVPVVQWVLGRIALSE